jgi:transposase
MGDITSSSNRRDEMQLKTILNRVEPQTGFVYAAAALRETAAGPEIEISVTPRKNGWPVCSGCAKVRGGYDRLPARRFQFVPLWGIAVFLVYAMRRVNCPACGIVVEAVPWAEGKHHATKSFMWFVAAWAKRLSWQETARIFHTNWRMVFHSVEMAVDWGRAHLDLAGLSAIGVDEIAWKKGHNYLTLVHQLDEGCRRLIWIGQKRTEKTLLRFFRWLGPDRAAGLKFVCSDMWKPYLHVIAQKASQAIHVLDRFHIAAHMNKAVDDVRREETRKLRERGKMPILKNSRWCLLKRPENLSTKDELRLADILRHNLKTTRGYLLAADFQCFWDYVSPFWAGTFLDRWCHRAMRSRIGPLQKVAKMLRSHRPLLLNWFRARGSISAGPVEGFNNKAKLTTRKAYGFRTYRVIEVALYHTLACLPEPEHTHKFW